MDSQELDNSLQQEYQDQDINIEDDFIPLQQKKQKKDKPSQKYIDHYAKILPTKQQVQQNAPLLCVIQGPPKSGKSTLIRSLVKHYTGQKVNQIKGSLTMRAGKKQRITFLQCPNSMSHMIDLAKIADLALLIIDASIGFQMETFQFLSLLKAHGLPNVLGVLNHLDYFKDGKQLKKTRKKYKKRFQSQLGSEYRLFYLQGIKYDGYQKRDIINMARYLSVIKYTKSNWKTDHSFLLIDRFQISQNEYQQDQQVDVIFNGYVRNSSFRLGTNVHFLGLGDYQIKQYKCLQDPCPVLEKGQLEKIPVQNQQEQLDYQDNKQIEQNQLKKKKKGSRKLKNKERILYAPSCNLGLLSVQQNGGYITIPDQHVIFSKPQKNQQQYIEQQEQEQGIRMIRQLQKGPKFQQFNMPTRLLQQVQIQQEQQNQSTNLKKSLSLKTKELRVLQATAKDAFQDQQQQNLIYQTGVGNLSNLIYKSKQDVCFQDTSRYETDLILSRQLFKNTMRYRFVTGMMNMQQEIEQEKQLQQENQKLPIAKLNISQDSNFITRGKYVRIILSGIKYKHVAKFDYKKPMVICRVNIAQDTKGFVIAKIKKHPWYGNLLKSGDPIIISSGWRRYQSRPIFYINNLNKANDKNRYLKYTPQHDFCWVAFYGNFCSQNTGILMTQTLNDRIKKFRVSATGYIVQFTQQPQIMKKLKLVGQPFKIFKNTAFVKGMFNSTQQVAEYQGAVLRTVSGLRGQIKKSVKQGGQGCFRATFEDKILKSDIVFCKTWFNVKPDKFYNPIISYQPMRLMKTTWELRKQKGLANPKNNDSQYKQIQRAPRKFLPFQVPKKLQGNLPFQSMDKIRISKKKRMAQKQQQGIPKLTGSNSQRKIQSLIHRLHQIRNEKQQMKKKKKEEYIRIKQARDQPRRKQIQANQLEKKKSKYKAQAKLKQEIRSKSK